MEWSNAPNEDVLNVNSAIENKIRDETPNIHYNCTANKENLQDIHDILYLMLKEVEILKNTATVYESDSVTEMDTMMKCSGDVIVRWLRLFRQVQN